MLLLFVGMLGVGSSVVDDGAFDSDVDPGGGFEPVDDEMPYPRSSVAELVGDVFGMGELRHVGSLRWPFGSCWLRLLTYSGCSGRAKGRV